jgi:hypothetical protein
MSRAIFKLGTDHYELPHAGPVDLSVFPNLAFLALWIGKTEGPQAVSTLLTISPSNCLRNVALCASLDMGSCVGMDSVLSRILLHPGCVVELQPFASGQQLCAVLPAIVVPSHGVLAHHLPSRGLTFGVQDSPRKLGLGLVPGK